jgi:hypothetical protein
MEGAMCVRPLPVAVAVLFAITACDGGNEASTAKTPLAPTPTAVSCGDAPQLRQRAADERRRSDEVKSDQEKITLGTRASYLASLAIVADLKCRVTSSEADEAVKPAFEAARKAEAASSFYERAVRWGEADYIATEVVAILIQQLT